MRHKKLTTQFIRRLIFAVFTLLAFCIQCISLPAVRFGVPVFILIPLIVSISMYEKEFTGLFFGLLTGALWDLASPLTDGILALFFALLSYIICLLSRYILRNTLLCQIVVTGITSAVYSIFMLLYTGFSSGPDILTRLALGTYLPAIILTAVVSIPVYFCVRKTAVKFRYDKLNS